MDQGPSAAFVGPNTARHEHHGTWWTCLGTFWTGSWFSWLGSKDFESMRSCIHHLIICNRGLDKTNASSSTQLTHCPRERHYLLSHPGEPCRSTLASKALAASWCCIQSNRRRRIESRLLHLRGYLLEKQDPNEPPFHYMWVPLSRENHSELEQGNTHTASSVT